MRRKGEYVEIPPGLPPYLGQADWCSVAQAAIVFGRCEKTIRLWLKDGTFAEFGIRIYRDPTGMWHINVPPPSVEKTRKHLSGLKAAALT